MGSTKKMVLLALFVSQALVLNYIERAIPVPVPIPGVKIGLANIISLFAIAILGFREALTVVTVRTLIGSFFFGGGIISFLFSFSGGVLSCIAMYILYRKMENMFSVTMISITGAIFHNAGQLFVASLVLGNSKVFYYFPVLLVSGCITGFITGVAAHYTIDPLKRILKIGCD